MYLAVFIYRPVDADGILVSGRRLWGKTCMSVLYIIGYPDFSSHRCFCCALDGFLDSVTTEEHHFDLRLLVNILANIGGGYVHIVLGLSMYQTVFFYYFC